MRDTSIPRGRYELIFRRVVAVALAALLAAHGASAQTIEWIDGTGFWDVAGNWSPSPPGPGNDVVIDVAGVHTVTVRSTGGPFTVNSVNMNGGDETLAITNGSLTLFGASTAVNPSGNSVITNYTQSGGTLSGPGSVSVTGTASLTGGTMLGGGTTTLQGTTAVNGSTFNLDAGRILRNEGDLTWTSGSFNLNPNANNGSAGRIDNAVGATWVALSDSGMSASGADLNALPGFPAFNNDGTFVKSGGTGTTSFTGLAFNNSGTVDVQTGTVALNGGGTHTGAVLTGAGTIQFGGAHTFDAATQISTTNVSFIGGGTKAVASIYGVTGTTAVAGGTADLSAADLTSLGAALNVSGGVLNLGTHDASVTTLTFSGGTIAGAGTLTITGTAALTGASKSLDEGRSLRNEGMVTWAAGLIDLNPANNSGAGRIDNAAGATWDAQSDAAIFATASADLNAIPGFPAFNNAGTFVKSAGTGATQVDVAFNNTGTVEVQTGTVRLSRGGTHTGGAFSGAGTIEFWGAHTLDATTEVTAAHARLGGPSGGVTTINGLYNVTESTTLVGGTADLSNAVLPSATSLGTALNVLGGTLNLGGHDVTVTGAATLGGSTMTGAGTTTLQGTTTASNQFGLDTGRILRNEGNLTWAGSLPWFNLNATPNGGAGRIDNAAGALWTQQGSDVRFEAFGDDVDDVPGFGVFNNAGTFVSTAQQVVFNVPFINTGALEVQGGNTFLLQGGSTHSGQIMVGQGRVLELRSVNELNAGTTLSVQGILRPAGTVNSHVAADIEGTLQMFGGTLTLDEDWEAGTLSVSGGTIAGPGSLTVTGAATIAGGGTAIPTMTGGGTTTLQSATTIGKALNLDAGRTLRNEGSLVWTAGNIDLNSTAEGGSGRIDNAAGAVWDIQTGNLITATASADLNDLPGFPAFNNAGTLLKSTGTTATVSVQFNNTGIVDVQAGTLNLTQGMQGTSGTVFVDSGATLTLGGVSTVGTVSTAGTLALGANALTVHTDYANANFGTGDAFNPRANVTGTGAILAAGDVAQAVTGAGVTEGNTATPTLTIGNVRVGANTFEYEIANTGTEGPALRGALQTGVNGGNIDDPRLSGSGVAAGSFGPIGPGAGSPFEMIFTADAVGALAPLSGQAVNLANNFSNVGDQLLTIELAEGAGAFRLASGALSPDPIVINARVGDVGVSGVVTIANTAANDGFSESLEVTGAAASAAPFGISSSVGGLIAAGGSDALDITLDTATAGAFSGLATVSLESNGLGTSNIVPYADLGSLSVDLQANVFQPAVASVDPTAIVFNVRRGADADTEITIANVAPVAALSDVLRETGRTVTGDGFSVTGGPDDLAAGASRTATASLDASSVGSFNGSVTFDLASHNDVLADFDLGAHTVTLSGTVSQLANPVVQGTVDFGNVQQGSLQQQAITVTNDVLLSEQAFTDLLNASFDPELAAGIASLTGNITGLAGGLSDTTSMVIQLDTSAAGAVNATATVLLVSDGTAFGFGLTDLPSQTVDVLGTVEVSGSVFRLAEATIDNPQPIAFGNVREGDTAPVALLSITNSALDDGFSESLNASAGATTGGVTAAGSFTLLGAGQTNAAAIGLSMDTSTAGSRNGTATIAFASDGTGTSGAGLTPLPSQVVEVTGGVYRLAQGTVTPDPLVLNARVGDAGVSGALTIANTAANDGFSESLAVTSVTTTGAPFGTAGSAGGLIAAGGSTSGVQVTLDTATAGAFAGLATVGLESSGLGTSGIVPNAVLGSQSVALEANVYQAAAASVVPSQIDLGFVRRGDAAGADITITNSAPVAALNDVLVETNRVVSGSGYSVAGAAGDLGAGESWTVEATLDTSAVGSFNGSLGFHFASRNPVLADLDLGTETVALSGTVTQLATPVVQGTLDFGNVQQGSVQQQAITVTNDVLLSEQAFTDLLNASFDPTLAAGIASLSGSITGLAGGLSDNTSMVVQLDTSAAGAVNASATVLLVSDGTAFGLGLTGLPSQTVQVLGTVEIGGSVFRLAEATIGNAQPIALGATRVGDAASSALLSITNSAAADGFSESLNGAAGATTGSVTATGSFNLLAAGQTNDTAIGVSIGTAVAGSHVGTATITFASDGTGTSGAGITPLASQDVTVTANVYQGAVASVAPVAIDLGVARVGDAPNTAAIDVSNVAPAVALNDVLRESGRSVDGPFTLAGILGDLAAGDTSTLTAGLSTASAGMFAGEAFLSFVSHNPEMADADAGEFSVALTGQVNNLAAPAFELLGGDGTLSGGGVSYLLDFGTVAVDSGLVTLDAELGISNIAAGPAADWLSGSFDLPAGSLFDLTGFTSFFDLVAGDTFGGLGVGLTVDTTGLLPQLLSDSLILNPLSVFPGLTDLALDPITLQFRANLVSGGDPTVPEPAGLLLLLLGGAGVAWRTRRLRWR